jgi:hypothetical protein
MTLLTAPPAILLDMPEDVYRAHPAVANSDLNVIRTRSPAHLLARRRNPEKVTPAKLDGRALHCAILEPDAFLARYCVLPVDAPRRPSITQINAKNPSDETRRAIDWWATWEAANGSRITLDAADYDEKMRIADNIRRHPKLRAYFDAPDRQHEVSLFARDPETGTEVKARQDHRCSLAGFRICLDPKSTEDCRPDAFARSAIQYGYFQQAAFYTDISAWAGDPLDLFLFIAFEKEDPYAVKVYEVQEDELDFGRELYRPALNTWAECLRTGVYPAYDDDIEPLIKPVWAKAA